MMEESVAKIASWASMGTLEQFRTEVEARVSKTDYSVEREGNTLLFYRTRKEGGFLGIGAKTVKEPVMKIVKEGPNVEIPDDPLDPEFVAYLASGLRHH